MKKQLFAEGEELWSLFWFIIIWPLKQHLKMPWAWLWVMKVGKIVPVSHRCYALKCSERSWLNCGDVVYCLLNPHSEFVQIQWRGGTNDIPRLCDAAGDLVVMKQVCNRSCSLLLLTPFKQHNQSCLVLWCLKTLVVARCFDSGRPNTYKYLWCTSTPSSAISGL